MYKTQLKLKNVINEPVSLILLYEFSLNNCIAPRATFPHNATYL